MKNDVAEATKLMTIAKAKMEAAKEVLTQCVSEGMENMKRVRKSLDDILLRIKRKIAERNNLEQVVLKKQMAKSREYSRTVVETLSKFGSGSGSEKSLRNEIQKVENELSSLK